MHILTYHFFTYVGKRNNVTDLFSEIYEHMLFTSYLNFMCVFRCVFLANYVSKCQMISGPYGPIFKALQQSKIATELKNGLRDWVQHPFESERYFFLLQK